MSDREKRVSRAGISRRVRGDRSPRRCADDGELATIADFGGLDSLHERDRAAVGAPRRSWTTATRVYRRRVLSVIELLDRGRVRVAEIDDATAR